MQNRSSRKTRITMLWLRGRDWERSLDSRNRPENYLNCTHKHRKDQFLCSKGVDVTRWVRRKNGRQIKSMISLITIGNNSLNHKEPMMMMPSASLKTMTLITTTSSNILKVSMTCQMSRRSHSKHLLSQSTSQRWWVMTTLLIKRAQIQICGVIPMSLNSLMRTRTESWKTKRPFLLPRKTNLSLIRKMLNLKQSRESNNKQYMTRLQH